MWLRNLCQLSADSDRSQSAGRRKGKKRQESIRQLGAGDPSGGQLTAKVKPLIVVKETMLAMHVRVLPSPLLRRHPMALL
ncbi:hypothetical protein PBY51_018676 [Eleginops maclovinus]|uniref:Uncharacterized protein n=1 Tax=Eleginops maclovinus TaxID=56733 RepID=A0AAN7Y7P8_ELEMC|nr:hypothetical protein PBY51_018676 [Eleginops maclovinus]